GDRGVVLSFADVTVVAQSIRVSPHRDGIRAGLAGALGLGVQQVSVKATTTDGLGLTGRGEGIAALAVVTVDVS
ncbi:MAG: 2-C-methyl-D-erythritol 2,4-cyclodiphosphate synthase, partial [Acidimicrobiia bacterium]|nr:2-C-methyl-D-erythritol 2,4-cyclodiphosphate synthase [Acidimicrobiia bacterium]